MGWSLEGLFWKSNGKPVRAKSFKNIKNDSRYKWPRNKVTAKGKGWPNFVADLLNFALKNKK